MDMSDTSDFESADEFLSDLEDFPDKKNENKRTGNEDKKIEITKADIEIADFQKPQQCYEPGMDFRDENESSIFGKASETLHNITIGEGKNEGEIADILPEKPQIVSESRKFGGDDSPIFYKNNQNEKSDGKKECELDESTQLKENSKNQKKENIKNSANEASTSEVNVPRIRTTCWVPALNEANKKRKENEKYPPKPPSIDRDGNPIIYKVVEKVGKSVEVLEKRSGNPTEDAKNSKNEPPTSEMDVRTSCWIPELHESNVNLKQRTENEKYPPKPPTVNRDGNPIIYKTNSNKDNEIKESSSQKTTSQEIQIEVTARNLENTPPMSDMDVKTTCWVPELHEVNVNLNQRMENEKYPPKPPTVDRHGNPIVYKRIAVEKSVAQTEEKDPDEDKDNLWDTAETWEEHEEVEIEKNDVDKSKMVVKDMPEKEDNLWDNNDPWEVDKQPDLHTHDKLMEKKSKDQENLEETWKMWKDGLGVWGDDDNWANQETTLQKTPDSVKQSLEAELKQPDSSISSDDNMWENDTWESVENDPENIKPLGSALDSLTQKDQQSWSNWGNWGISSVLNTVSQGLTTVIGVPNPEELAKQHIAQKQQTSEEFKDISEEKIPVDTSESGESFVGLGTIVSGVTKLVETTGTKVISGGLGTLETIGKKTMEVLQENDPGLKKKRAFLKKIEPERTVLSQVLREAKEKSEMSNVAAQDTVRKERKVDYEIMFDDYQGLVHIEALAMLSRQCSIKLTTVLSHLSGPALTDLQETLDQVKELCELPDDSLDQQTTTTAAFRDAIETAVSELGVAVNFAASVLAWEELAVHMAEDTNAGVYRNGVTTLARFTALAVEQMHRSGELLLVKERRSTVDEADSLVQISSAVISMLNTVASLFTDRLNELATVESKAETNQYITNIFFESSNSTQYVRQAFQLLIPVLQVGAT